MPDSNVIQYEVEQKFRLKDGAAIDQIVLAVKQLGGSWLPAEQHADTYYAHPCRSFPETDEALRIRTIDGKHFVTYKGPKIRTETKTRRELELPLNPPDFGPDQLHELWTALGFTPVATVRKSRRKAKLTSGEWTFGVDLDTVEGVGDFVELETMSEESQIDDAQKALHDLANQLNLDSVVRKSYLAMLLESHV